jgi:SseB protein N-terminal domain
VSFYIVTDLSSFGPADSEGNSMAEIHTLQHEGRTILPVFTFEASFWAYTEARYAGDDAVRPAPVPMDPFRLVEMITQLERLGGLDALVFNPSLNGVGELVPVAEYCGFIENLRPRLEDAAREARERFGDPPPGSEAFKERLDLMMMRSIEAADDIAGLNKERQPQEKGSHG